MRLGERQACGSSSVREGTPEACDDGTDDGGGDGDADPGKGIWEGVRGVESSASATTETIVFLASRLEVGALADLVFAFEVGFFETGEEGAESSGAEASTTSGRPG